MQTKATFLHKGKGSKLFHNNFEPSFLLTNLLSTIHYSFRKTDAKLIHFGLTQLENMLKSNVNVCNFCRKRLRFSIVNVCGMNKFM